MPGHLDLILGALPNKGVPALTVPPGTPTFLAHWRELGADSTPLELHQLAHGAHMADVLAAAVAAETRTGRVTWGRVVDLITGEVVTEIPSPDLPDLDALGLTLAPWRPLT